MYKEAPGIRPRSLSKQIYNELLTNFAINYNLRPYKKACTDNSATPLYIAAYHGNMAMVDWLIAARADVNAARSDGYTPLKAAVAREHMDVAQKLRAAGATESRW